MAEHFAAQRDHYPEVLAPVGDFERLTYAFGRSFLWSGCGLSGRHCLRDARLVGKF